MRHRSGTASERWCTERTVLVRALTRDARAIVVLAAFAGTVAACRARDDGGESRRATAPAAQSESASASPHGGAAVVGPKPVCPATGTWQICSVIERLERAGLAPRRDEGDA